ncbi:hypothetical protein GE09DRAFT_1137995 [Coniochaeta sp. 2T2.1]|nr:hypothetical protein GE09DRAFT_1137995 [Coniochaeta sp. 2T2.1]
MSEAIFLAAARTAFLDALFGIIACPSKSKAERKDWYKSELYKVDLRSTAIIMAAHGRDGSNILKHTTERLWHMCDCPKRRYQWGLPSAAEVEESWARFKAEEELLPPGVAVTW